MIRGCACPYLPERRPGKTHVPLNVTPDADHGTRCIEVRHLFPRTYSNIQRTRIASCVLAGTLCEFRANERCAFLTIAPKALAACESEHSRVARVDAPATRR